MDRIKRISAAVAALTMCANICSAVPEAALNILVHHIPCSAEALYSPHSFAPPPPVSGTWYRLPSSSSHPGILPGAFRSLVFFVGSLSVLRDALAV